MSFSDAQVKALTADLNRANVAQRTQAGRSLSYIEGWHAEAEANRIFGFHGWDSETLDLRMVSERARKIGSAGKDGWSVSYLAKVRVVVTTPDGQEIIRDGVGAGHGIDVDLGLAHESAAKEACTDAEKRALKTFGNPFGLALYDKTQAHVSDGAPPAEPNTSGGRKSSAQAKRDGDDEKIKAEIAGLDKTGLADFHAHFDEYTATMPRGWLEPIQDMLENRLIEINGTASVATEEADMDAGFSGAVGREVSAPVARRNGAMAA